MKTTIAALTVLALAGTYCMAANPADPALNGLTPRTPTFYLNNIGVGINNTNCGGGGVAINSAGNVIFGWADNKPTSGNAATPGSQTNSRLSLLSWGAAWVVYDNLGNPVSPLATIVNGGGPLFDPPIIGVDASQAPVSVNTRYRSFFREDGTPMGGRYAKDPKIKANHFGPGFSLLAASFPITNNPNAGVLPYLEIEAGLGWEIPSLLAINNDNNGLGGYGSGGSGQFPAVQMLKNDMTPDGYRTGGTDANMEALGIVRVADVEYLANGNMVIASSSEQVFDWTLTTQSAGKVPVYRVLNAAGVEIKAYSPVIQTPGFSGELWHGLGVTANGFAIKSRIDAAGARLELFDNDGNPTSSDLALQDITGIQAFVAIYRGEQTGWHGNGTDAYVLGEADIIQEQFGTGNNDGNPMVAVINEDGTLRWARRATDLGEPIQDAVRMDAAIAPDGRVIAVWDTTQAYGATTHRTVVGRMFDKYGNAMGATFYVGESENPAPVANSSRCNPRIAWRDNVVAILWESTIRGVDLGTSPATPRVMAARIFDTAPYVAPAPSPITNFKATLDGLGNVVLTWDGGSPPFNIEAKDGGIESGWNQRQFSLNPLSHRSYTEALTAGPVYFQVRGHDGIYP